MNYLRVIDSILTVAFINLPKDIKFLFIATKSQ